ncbi:hypothetical protein EVAR_96089_1 [Eumeta japonica]|uniref:Uncharacterized protein n=1 Tax=Eumeta variegata TaxID=151549 RepID=A0A4C1VDY5_EUMVA|nr:hypothetical protein EVAR_96089_1 [Eumeta japonica]
MQKNWPYNSCNCRDALGNSYVWIINQQRAEGRERGACGRAVAGPATRNVFRCSGVSIIQRGAPALDAGQVTGDVPNGRFSWRGTVCKGHQYKYRVYTAHVQGTVSLRPAVHLSVPPRPFQYTWPQDIWVRGGETRTGNLCRSSRKSNRRQPLLVALAVWHDRFAALGNKLVAKSETLLRKTITNVSRLALRSDYELSRFRRVNISHADTLTL